jgi:hypothetical protein
MGTRTEVTTGTLFVLSDPPGCIRPRIARFLGSLNSSIRRCLVVADLHHSLPLFDWLLAAAPEFTSSFFAGDALDIGSFVDFRAQILMVKKRLPLLSGIDAGHFLLSAGASTRLQQGTAHFGMALNECVGIALNSGIRDIRSLTAWRPLRY